MATATREKPNPPHAPLTGKAVTRPASAKPATRTSLTKPSAATRKPATRVSTENVTPNQLNAAVSVCAPVPAHVSTPVDRVPS